MKDICLLLTAAIEVRNKSLVKRNDTATRLNDYKVTLKRWLTEQKSVSKIVLIDCSGYPLDELKSIVAQNNPYKKEVELMSFVTSGRANEDKSYGELLIDRYALDNSRLLKGATHFIHTSGRVFIENIDAIINGLPDEFDMVSIFQNNLSNSQLDTWISKKDFFNREMYQYLISNVDDNKKLHYERVFVKALHQALAKDYRWFPFAVEPIVRGVSGTKNELFRMGKLRSYYITLLEHLLDRVRRNSHGKNRPHLLDL